MEVGMKKRALAMAIWLGASTVMSGADAELSIFRFTMNDIDGNAVPLETFKGKVVLVVNTASQCGLTPQYEGLQALYQKYKDKGFVVLGFPANNFGNQEPGSNEQIKEFCSSNFGVGFPMFAKISVKGEDMHPLYQYLTAGAGNPQLAGEITWNFEKFLFDRSGQVAARFAPKTRPESEEIVKAVETLLTKD
jgi:glutathione peroxidase